MLSKELLTDNFLLKNINYFKKFIQKKKLSSPKILNNLSFYYGPDIIRGHDHQFYVLEDNVGGNVGGFTKISHIHNKFQQSFSQFNHIFEKTTKNHHLFFKNILNEIKKIYQISEEQMALALFQNPEEKYFYHDLIINQWKSNNIVPHFFHYKITKKSLPKNIKYFISAFSSNFFMKSPLLQEYLKENIITETIFSDFLGDKEIYLYVENFIRYYLNEEPILKNVPTKSLAYNNDSLMITNANLSLLKKVLSPEKK